MHEISITHIIPPLNVPG